MSTSGYAVRRGLTEHRLFKGRRPLLSRLDIELTERCNHACQHCYINLPANDTLAQSRELNTTTWKDILSQAAELGALTVRFTGGEPLLREDFQELYLFARRLGMKVVLFTNACLITSELVELFAKVPPLMNLEVSVYGMQTRSYEAVTCAPGSFVYYRRGLDLLLEKQIPFFVKSVLLPPNRSEIDEFEAWAATIPWMDRKPAYAVFLDHRARRDLPAKNRLIDRLRFTPEEGLAFLTRQDPDYSKNMTQFCANFIGPQGARLFSCGAGETGCVDAYGKYQMCMMLRHPDTVVDLRQSTLRQALTEVFPRLRVLRASNPEYLKRCARCFLRGLCEQCPAKSWSEYGTLDTPVEYLCELAHLQARYLGLLGENEYGWEIQEWQTRVNALAKRYNVKMQNVRREDVAELCELDR